MMTSRYYTSELTSKSHHIKLGRRKKKRKKEGVLQAGRELLVDDVEHVIAGDVRESRRTIDTNYILPLALI
jgi:hypothetical protein